MNTIKAVDRFHINLSQLLGQGSFAKVYKAFDAQDMTIEAAVKMVSLAKLQRNKEGLDLFAREVEVLEKIKSKHIAQLLDVKMTPNHLYMFMEFCDGGSLGTHLAKGRTFTEEEACSIIRQVASAFVDIENLSLTNKHGEKVTVMHRDIKPDNILFHKGQIKVADFGFAKLVSEGGRTLKRAHTLCGTPCYEAPQILNRQLYSAKCDIWSTGVVFYELLFGIIPWARSPAARLEHAVQARPLYFPKAISNETKDLIHRMLMVREEDRISWREVLRHPALSPKQDIMREPVKLVTQTLGNERAWTPYPNKRNVKNDNGQHTDRQDRVDYGPYKQQEKEKREYLPYKQERMKTEDYAPYKQEKRTGQRLDVSPMKGEAAPINKQEGLAWPKLDTLQPRKIVQDKENLKVEPLKTLQNKTFALKTEVQVTPKFVSSKELLELEAKYKRSVIERRY